MLLLHHEAGRLVEPEVVATSPNRIKSPVPVFCGISSLKLVLAAGIAPAVPRFQAEHVAATPRTQQVEAVGFEPTSPCLRDRCLPSVGHTSISNADLGTRNLERKSTKQSRSIFLRSAFRVPSSAFMSGSGEESNPAGIKPSVLETEHAPRREPHPCSTPWR